MEIIRGPGLWWDGLAETQRRPRPAPANDTTADVVIVGAGFTGLWTAYYLRLLAPERSVIVVERRLAGYGASGRNCGWCSGFLPNGLDGLAREHGRQAAMAMQRAAIETVSEVERVVAAERIDCGIRRGGSRLLARNRAQANRLARTMARLRSFGFGPEDYRLLDKEETSRHLAVSQVVGSAYTPHCAVLNPAKLVRGLAAVVERHGAVIHEQTPVLSIDRGRVRTEHGVLEGDMVVLATEGYTAGLPGLRRELAPVHSHMIATDPLPESFWRQVGWADRATVADQRHHFAYMQRTEDDRIAIGGRGITYPFGSRVSSAGDRSEAIWARLRHALAEMFPQLGKAGISHRWGGPIAFTRTMEPSAGIDRARRLAWAGGYGGDGVALSNLAGRTLAHLIIGIDTGETRLPWAGVGRRWEPEPLRWLGVRAASALAHLADFYADRLAR
ncbi:glycine/D-amino acid oxidase-like deaminating enzyme [Thermocatellispora tengchongensis]|uniref:Glycine/D-amino acid oxidase-like deaminating enzyme n=1 Tax=Thermocatellispora tengchongensis TaxID=1073253 RepID=A0A840NYX1_9ACTN|nr:FAD-dependent oxidoreductase [Thermocatellispora tengchongensis]MBB5131396.1 glycine/D-amino acid oxidase-like deaminating enzyme [Thermocatellispora tengchongensis]